jgi:hypothetical protein
MCGALVSTLMTGSPLVATSRPVYSRKRSCPVEAQIDEEDRPHAGFHGAHVGRELLALRRCGTRYSSLSFVSRASPRSRTKTRSSITSEPMLKVVLPIFWNPRLL